MSVEEEHAGVQEGMERSGWGNIPSQESEKVLERSYRRVTRVQEKKLERLYPRRRRESA